MSSQTIELHFKEIMSLVSRMKEVKRKFSSLAGEEMMQIISSIQAGWNSECADILTGKEVKIVSMLLEEAEHLNALAEEMEDQAEKMYQREIINVRLAFTRNYS